MRFFGSTCFDLGVGLISLLFGLDVLYRVLEVDLELIKVEGFLINIIVQTVDCLQTLLNSFYANLEK